MAVTAKSAILVVLVVVMVGCIQGPAGKDGEDGANGRDGKSITLSTFTGILYPDDEVKATTGALGYWDIQNPAIRDDRLVSVYVRQGGGFMWKPPTWLLGNGYVRIGNDDEADPSWEYKIIVGN